MSGARQISVPPRIKSGAGSERRAAGAESKARITQAQCFVFVELRSTTLNTNRVQVSG
jgi:hypothetical protein